jgi:hypothetical protein
MNVICSEKITNFDSELFYIYKSSINQIPKDLIQTGSNTLSFEIRNIISVWNEDQPLELLSRLRPYV